MTTKDFETAISALNCGIYIDEVVKEDGRVFAVYGHTDSVYLFWDQTGRGFSCSSTDPLPTDRPLETRMEVDLWSREVYFDLKFE